MATDGDEEDILPEMPCECVSRHPELFEDVGPCGVDGPNGLSCTRPDGHGGLHTACGAMHPSHGWSDT